MKKILFLVCFSVILFSCAREDQNNGQSRKAAERALSANVPLDKGFSRYVATYTSGTILSTSSIEVQFTPEFAEKADRSARGLFRFEPAINGKTEWKDDFTLVFIPSKPLEQGKIYTGMLELSKLGPVEERLSEFPLWIQTPRKDFRVVLGAVSALQDGSGYNIKGTISSNDFIDNRQVEKILNIKIDGQKPEINWEHQGLDHVFSISPIRRNAEEKNLIIEWDGSVAGIKKKGSSYTRIPAEDDFSVLGVFTETSGNKQIHIVFSDPVDPSQDLTGIVGTVQQSETDISTSLNVVTIFLSSAFQEGTIDLQVEPSLMNAAGKTLGKPYKQQLDFSKNFPEIEFVGDGVILPSSKNLILPFRAVNLKAVDLRIVKIYEDNLPHFLQDGDITNHYGLKRFGTPVYSGKINLVTNTDPGSDEGKYNLHTIDLSDYIDVEPGTLYNVTLKFRRSYSLYSCVDSSGESSYEQLLQQSEEKLLEAWNNPNVYYEDPEDELYWSYGFDWNDRDDPCKDAYYSPDRRRSKNLLASNLGVIAKKGDNNELHVIVNDLITAMPVNEATIDVYDYQLQKTASGITGTEGSAKIVCTKPPFLVIVSKGNDRNYLKTNEGSALSMSSFDVSGTRPEKGIKAFIYGERDVWRPGDSIFLTVIMKDMKSVLPADHPVQFELIDPAEQKVDNQVQRADGKTMLVFKTSTNQDGITGDYKAVVRIGGATFTKRIRVESIKPNRLRIDLDFRDKLPGGSLASSEGSLRVKWLNGSVARNLNATVEYMLRPVKTEFSAFPGYIFDDPVKEIKPATITIFDKPLDNEGNAKVLFNPPDDLNAPGMLDAIFTIRAMEPGGDESITRTSYKFAPYKIFAGISFTGKGNDEKMLFTDRENEVKIVTVDENGKPVDSEVEVTIHKLTYKWWWESEREDLGYYISDSYYKPSITNKLQTKNGSASFRFTINREEWGRYLVRATLPTGHSTGRIILVDWPWDYGMKGKADGATLVAINTDKDKYKPGENVTLSFPSPENSRAIITLENSSGILDEIRTATGRGSTTVTFRATPAMTPNVYAYVSIIQPHAQTVNDLPVRLYGITPVIVEDPETRLDPVITMPDELRSVKPFTVKVTEKNRKAMTYTIAIVDEGLLDLTGFKTPDPWNYFYSREALAIHTWDLYDNVLGAFGGTLERIFAVGGDEALLDRTANKAQRFIPVVKFLGPFRLEAGKTGIHIVSLPQYTGSVRTMVIGGNDLAFGFTEKSVPVKDPLMALVTAPRVVSPGEKVSLPVTLFVQKNGINEVKLSAAGENVTFDKSTIVVKVPSPGEINAKMEFIAGKKTGIAKIAVNASGGGETASYALEIDIRNPNLPETRSEIHILDKEEKWETSFDLFGTEGTNSAFLEISPIPSINLEKKLDFLTNYPHGCSEQTASAAFPQLYIKNISSGNQQLNSKITSNIREAINIISSRQMSNGGVAMWPGAYQPDNWITSYTGHFMIEAEKNGYNIPSGFRTRWLNYQTRLARDWRLDPRYIQSTNDQAYRLFTLALAGQPERGAMNRLRESSVLPNLSRWLLAAAYAISGRPEASQDLLDTRNTSTEQEYMGYYYGSEMRDKSIILFTLSVLKNEALAFPVLKEICDKFNNATWYSTQDAAWALISYMKFMEMMQPGNTGTGKISIDFNGRKEELSLTPGKILKSELPISANNNLLVQNTSGEPVYITLTRKGTPLTAAALADAGKGLKVNVSYFDTDLKNINHTSLSQGTDFVVVVKVTNTTFADVSNIALTHPVPSGWEIRNTRMFDARYGITESSYTYRDFRDDRVNTYFNLAGGETKTFVAVVSAAYQGEFILPAIWCEAMYTPGFYSGISGGNVKVTEPEFE